MRGEQGESLLEFFGFGEDDTVLRIHRLKTRCNIYVAWFAIAPVLGGDHVRGVTAKDGAFRPSELALHYFDSS